MNTFDILFPHYFIFCVIDYGTTWYEPNLAEACTASGVTAVPGDAVPGCMIPGYYAA